VHRPALLEVLNAKAQALDLPEVTNRMLEDWIFECLMWATRRSSEGEGKFQSERRRRTSGNRLSAFREAAVERYNIASAALQSVRIAMCQVRTKERLLAASPF
jgi:hypothetical protein